MAFLLQPYELPLVRYDVCEPETMKDIIYSLDSLKATMDNMFDQLEAAVCLERGRLANINQRVAVCHTKVQAFKGSKRPTTVFSTARFPGTETFPLFSNVYQEAAMENIRSTCREIEEDVQYLHADLKNSSVDNTELTVELQALLCRLHSYGSDIERVELIMEDEGLGKISPNVQSVGSLLVFNSNIDPWKSYHTMDNLVSSGRTRAFEEHSTGPKPLASAPTSLLLGIAQPDLVALDLTFKPSQGVVTALELPANLPLAFVADISYSNDPTTRGTNPSTREQLRRPSAVENITITKNILLPPPPPPHTQSSTPSTIPLPPPPSVSSSSFFPPAPPLSPRVEDLGHTTPTLYVQHVQPVRTAEPATQTSVTSSDEIDTADMGGAGTGVGGGVGKSPGFLDAIRGMSVSNLRSSSEPRAAGPSSSTEKKGPISMLDEMKERMRRRNSALTGKVDKEKQRRDLEIINAARENNLFNMSLISNQVTNTHTVSVGRPVAPPRAHTISPAELHKKAMVDRNTKDDSDNSSVDSYSVSEVSCEDVAFKHYTTQPTAVPFRPSPPISVTKPTHTMTPVIPVVSQYSAPLIPRTQVLAPPPVPPPLPAPTPPPIAPQYYTPAPAPAPASTSTLSPPQQPPVTVPTPIAPQPQPSVPLIPKIETLKADGGGGGGGGLLDATRSSAVSQMLQYAKQKEVEVSDGSDDGWED